MNKRDKALIRDIFHFTAINRAVTVKAFEIGLIDLEKFTKYIETSLNPEKPEDLVVSEIKENNQTYRVQSILIAKIFAELIAAFEDLGAFCSAIRFREKGGIFTRYNSSSVGESADFYDFLIKADLGSHPETTLAEILNLPLLNELSQKLDGITFEAVKHDYQELQKAMLDAAEMYRATPGDTNVNSINELDPNWVNDINILVGTVSERARGGILAIAFNKIKHRFMLTENLPLYADANSEDLKYSRLPQESDFVLNKLIANTLLCTKIICELAGLLIILDDVGIEL